MKKLVAILLSLALLLTSAAALAEIPATFRTEGYPIVDEPVTISVGYMRSPNAPAYEEMQVWQDFMKLTGVNIEFVEMPLQNAQETFNLMMATDSYPDVWYGRIAGVEASNVAGLYGPAGIFLDLSDLIDQYAPSIKAMFDSENLVFEKIAVEGKVYALPRVNNSNNQYVEDKWYINKVWLDKLGLAVPTTPAELRTVLEAFRDNDCNGNGDPSDEIPMSLWAGYYGMGSLYGPWGVVDNQFNHMMVGEDGSLLFVPMADGYREGLAYWRDMYADGLLWNQTFTIGNDEFNAVAQGEDEIMGSFLRHVGDYVVGSERYFDYTHVPALKGENGSQLWKMTESPTIYKNCFMITDRCKYPEVAIRMADYFYTVQGSFEFSMGPENLTWRWNDDGTYSSIPAPEGVSSDDWMNGNCPGGYSLCYTSLVMSKMGKPADPESLSARIGLDFIDHAELYKPFQPVSYVPTLTFTAEEQEELDLIQGTIFSYVKEMEAKFIIGAEDLSKWDDYTAALNAMGIDRLMSIYQTAYNRLMGV